MENQKLIALAASAICLAVLSEASQTEGDDGTVYTPIENVQLMTYPNEKDNTQDSMRAFNLNDLLADPQVRELLPKYEIKESSASFKAVEHELIEEGTVVPNAAVEAVVEGHQQQQAV